MAVLSDADRAQVWARAMRHWSQAGEPLGALTKAELRAAVNAVDAWADSNAAAFNSAIPQPARAQLTASQKAILLAYVCLRRAGEG